MWIWSIIWSAGAEPVPTSTTERTPVTESEPLRTIDQTIQDVLQHTLKKKPSAMVTAACPKNQCSRYSDTNQEAYDRAFFDDGQWLAFANQYGVGQILLPNTESIQPRQFVEWKQDKRALKVLMEHQQPKAFFATWQFESLKPMESPFVYTRLSPLQNAKKWPSSHAKYKKSLPKMPITTPLDGKGAIVMDGLFGCPTLQQTLMH